MSNPIAMLKARAIAASASSVTIDSSRSNDPAAASQPTPRWSSTWPAPAPCPKCACPAFWIDVYGGGPHCRNCNKPSSRSLVKFHAWVLDTDLGFEWVRDPRAGSRNVADGSSSSGGFDDRELVTWRLPDGRQVTALRTRVDPTRVAGPGGRYSPALACGPVGDLSFDEWFERLPDLADVTSRVNPPLAPPVST